MSHARLAPTEPLEFRYKLGCSFVVRHHPLAPLVFSAFSGCSRCTHLRSSTVTEYSKCFLVEARCRQRPATAAAAADIAPVPAVAVAAAAVDVTTGQQQFEDDPSCDGEDGVSVRLCETALRFLMDRSAMRFVPFDFVLTMPFGVERADSTPEYFAHELAESLLPLLCVRTPLLWVMLASPASVDARDSFNGYGWIECAATSFFLFSRYRHILYSIHRAACNELMTPEIKKSAETQERDGSNPPQLAPIQKPDYSNRLKEFTAERAKRAQRFADGMNVLFQRYSKLATMHLRNTRKALQAIGSKADAESKRREALFKYTVQVLNTMELHIMELCEVPRELRSSLLTPHAAPGAWKRLQSECDERAVGVAEIALKRRADLAALPPAPPDETEVQWVERMNGMEDLYPPHISNDTLRAVKCADHYNGGVLVPLLRDEMSREEDAALAAKIDVLAIAADNTQPPGAGGE